MRSLDACRQRGLSLVAAAVVLASNRSAACLTQCGERFLHIFGSGGLRDRDDY